ncbi:MGH1-like glycoside hydrolase domain-containing protein [Streptosporangium jomthongense]|uniref:Mannosylglycerate hydrolase MGH1-like glycoside hydrolase domain-containing protein n=1 Tax=Streptosporangium jomthongense TaxID=1193683 RepID=A0ABV8F127_9ACTN
MEGRTAVDDVALGREAWSVLDANRAGAVTVPAPGLYPHQWNWDSTFVAIGVSRCDTRRAGTELLSLLAGQWHTGMVPHIVFNRGLADAYFPGPSVWRSGEHPAAPNGVPTSGLTQPPLHALATWWMWRHARNREEARGLVRRLYPMLVAQHDYLATARDLGGGGLAAIVHPWESGMDDSPVWDGPLDAVTQASGAHGEEPFPDRYVWLAQRYRDSGYDPAYLRAEHPFAVEDPLFNGIWLASCQALAELAPLAGADPAPHREAAERIRAGLLERLWGGEAFHALDLRSGRLSPMCTVGAFGPMLDPGLPADRVAKLVGVLESARFMGAAGYPVPSCEIRATQFDRSRYWRGPSWVNTNWLLRRAAAVHGLDGLARLLGVCTLRLVRQAGFRECFDPFDGSGRGSRDFSWSAALTLDLLADNVEG